MTPEQNMADILDEWFGSLTISEAQSVRERFVRFMQGALRNQDTLFEACTDDWTSVRSLLPPENEVVDTKIDDVEGVRNQQPLKRQKNLWFLPDGSMYVYCTPTHWRAK
jgi:hypothetical protein